VLGGLLRGLARGRKSQSWLQAGREGRNTGGIKDLPTFQRYYDHYFDKLARLRICLLSNVIMIIILINSFLNSSIYLLSKKFFRLESAHANIIWCSTMQRS